MHSLNFLVVELETARTKLRDVFEEANGTSKWTWRATLSGWAGWLTTDNHFNRPSGTGASPHRYPGPKGRAPKGLEVSAQGFNPGKRHPERFALTRHMNVRSMNNTRSSGLEMLKGRQIERTNNAKVGPIVARLNCAL
jgi:hypothetical protein